MQIESILIFIAFVVISSFANKRREAQQRQRQQQKQTQKTTTTGPAAATTVTPKEPKATPQKMGKRTLQDLFREMQQELETEYRQAQEAVGNKKKTVTAPKAAPEMKQPLTYESKNPDIGAPSGRTMKEKKSQQTSGIKKNSPIYEDEIKDMSMGIEIDLSQESVLKGIVFSEILGKPKALK